MSFQDEIRQLRGLVPPTPCPLEDPRAGLTISVAGGVIVLGELRTPDWRPGRLHPDRDGPLSDWASPTSLEISQASLIGLEDRWDRFTRRTAAYGGSPLRVRAGETYVVPIASRLAVDGSLPGPPIFVSAFRQVIPQRLVVGHWSRWVCAPAAASASHLPMSFQLDEYWLLSGTEPPSPF